MSAFAAALAALAADPNMGVTAVWRVGGTGVGVPIRVLRSSPDVTSAAFETSIVQPTDVLTVAVDAIASPDAGDTIAIGAEVLTVQHAERDATGVAWRVFCRR
jgi:energy-converting hydrogenase Eha subunit A